MKYLARLFRPHSHRLILPPPIPPLIERRPWNEYTQKMRQVLDYDIQYDLGELTEEDRRAYLTMHLSTPSGTTPHDVNKTGRWHVYSDPTLKVDIS